MSPTLSHLQQAGQPVDDTLTFKLRVFLLAVPSGPIHLLGVTGYCIFRHAHPTDARPFLSACLHFCT